MAWSTWSLPRNTVCMARRAWAARSRSTRRRSWAVLAMAWCMALASASTMDRSRRMPSAVHTRPPSSTSSAHAPGASRDARRVSASRPGVGVGSCIIFRGFLPELAVSRHARADLAVGKRWRSSRLVGYRIPAAILDRIGWESTPCLPGVRRRRGYHARPAAARLPSMPRAAVPLLTLETAAPLLQARAAGTGECELSQELGRSLSTVATTPEAWRWQGREFPYPARLRDRTIYHPDGDGWEPVSRCAGSLIKLVPTPWGPPT